MLTHVKDEELGLIETANLIGRASHRICDCVGSILTEVRRFFSLKRLSGFPYKCCQRILIVEHDAGTYYEFIAEYC